MNTHYLTIAACLLVMVPLTRAGQILDRMIATVNGHAILASDWDDELRYESFMSGHSLHDLTAENRRQGFERLIDQELLREQMDSADFKAASADEISRQMDDLRKRYAHDHNGQSWNEALANYKLTEPEIAAHVALELNALKLVDARLRPSIQIDAAAVEDYYRNELLPKVSGKQQITLQEAAPKIRELLLQEKMNELLTSWLQSLRAQGQIRVIAPETGGSQVAQ